MSKQYETITFEEYYEALSDMQKFMYFRCLLELDKEDLERDMKEEYEEYKISINDVIIDIDRYEIILENGNKYHGETVYMKMYVRDKEIMVLYEDDLVRIDGFTDFMKRIYEEWKEERQDFTNNEKSDR